MVMSFVNVLHLFTIVLYNIHMFQKDFGRQPMAVIARVVPKRAQNYPKLWHRFNIYKLRY